MVRASQENPCFWQVLKMKERGISINLLDKGSSLDITLVVSAILSEGKQTVQFFFFNYNWGFEIFWTDNGLFAK